MRESIWRHRVCYKDITLNCGAGCYSRLIMTKLLLTRAKTNSFTVAHRTRRNRFLSTYYMWPDTGLLVDCVWNVMAHAQKPDFVFKRNGRVHLNRRERQFSRLLVAELCASAVVMLDTHCSEVAWECCLPTPFASFPFTSPPVRHHVPSLFNWTLLHYLCIPNIEY